MSKRSNREIRRSISVAFGPRNPSFGSWQWIGEDIGRALCNEFDVHFFDVLPPSCDVAVFIKFKPDAETLRRLSCRVVYCPVDIYGSSAEIEFDASALGACDLAITHAASLEKYLSTYIETCCIDHHVKYASSQNEKFRGGGPLLWIGNRGNLPPVIKWVNSRRFDEELWFLTNFSENERTAGASELGFLPHNHIRVERWTTERHLAWQEQCRAAFDIKGEDFRSRHKPPTKAIDFLASGISFAINQESSPARYCRSLGFDAASPDDSDRWFSEQYWIECKRFGELLSSRLNLQAIASQWSRVIRSLLQP